MSLIPSESYSFPDHFTSTVVPSRRPKHEKAPPEKVRKQPTIVALPDPQPEPVVAINSVEPEVIAERSEAEVPQIKPFRPALNPALRRAQALPPRIQDAPIRKIALPATLKPGVRWNNRAPALDPSQPANNGNGHRPNELAPAPTSLPTQNVIPMKAPGIARPAQSVATPMMKASTSQPRVNAPSPPPLMKTAPPLTAPVKKPRPVAPTARPVQPQRVYQRHPPAPAAANPQADFFETFEDNSYKVANERRRQMKFRRFVACEIGAVAVLLPLIILGVALNITVPSLRWLLNVFTVTAAVLAAIIPIVFYAGTPTPPETER
jgi:hypothetical protein